MDSNSYQGRLIIRSTKTHKNGKLHIKNKTNNVFLLEHQ
ncbi:hypothetical protein DRF75_02280 [Ehrlichia minasensis]|uniref:Uncharacterized protein n=1 Tax=Ehrlichia minasensis TaxID=1242993 RepID=A0A4Q6I647_9RICK|nr:DUF3023 domain-containing protein [Ehrlichia minasensis]RZB12760.1 hypothetical protein DRF75_02280 [Ehrlichia minasensis]